MAKITNPNAAARELRRIREASGQSRRELAQSAGLSERTIYLWETDPQIWPHIRGQNLRRVEQALGMEAGYFDAFDDDAGEGDAGMRDRGTSGPGWTQPTEQDPYGDDEPAPLPSAGRRRVAQPRTGAEDRYDRAVPLAPIRRPLTLGYDDPPDEHEEERWDAQGWCFLEGLRQTYLTWLKEPKSVRTASALQEMVADSTAEWADQHAIQDPIDPQEVPGDLVIQEWDTDKFAPRGRKVQARAIPWPLTTQAVRAHETSDGTEYDIVEDDQENTWMIPCEHETDSLDAPDHEFVRLAPNAAPDDQDDQPAAPKKPTNARDKLRGLL